MYLHHHDHIHNITRLNSKSRSSLDLYRISPSSLNRHPSAYLFIILPRSFLLPSRSQLFSLLIRVTWLRHPSLLSIIPVILPSTTIHWRRPVGRVILLLRLCLLVVSRCGLGGHGCRSDAIVVSRTAATSGGDASVSC
jgi:hypothetical protein